MSSKTAEHPPGVPAIWPASRSWSITGRLTLLYTVSTGGMLVLSTGFLYWVLASNPAWEGHQFLADKIHVLRGVLREHPDDRDALEEEVLSEVAAHQYTRYYIRLLHAGGWTLLETPGMAAGLPVGVFPVPTGAQESPGDGMPWRSLTARRTISSLPGQRLVRPAKPNGSCS